jgi:glycosyltransferase involved in cell wall biosynthesis
VNATDAYCRGLVLRRDPNIILSSLDLPPGDLGVASELPELFRREASLHFLSPSWTTLGEANNIAKRIRQAAVDLPHARFIVLASDETELHALNKAGVEAMVGNHNSWIDETVFRPLTEGSATEFDAIYNARFSPFKNHHLCTHIERLALVHYHYPGMETNEGEVRAMLPHARILNEENSAGTYRKLPPQDVAAAANRAATGLCLSATEGAMSASMEYLLCGTPVVSIPNQGGRNRYLLPPYAEFAAPDPESVAQAVLRLKNRRLPRAMVREHMATLLAFERRNFLDAINLKIADMFGPGKEITDFGPFRKANTRRSKEQWRKEILA